MSGINDNQGDGWGVSQTPYGDITNYDPSQFGSTSYKAGSTGNTTATAQPGTTHGGYLNLNNYNKAASNAGIGSDELARIVDNTIKWEGLVHNMYADTKGNVTVGIGTLLSNVDDAKKMKFGKRNTFHAHGDDEISYTSASDDQVAAAYQHVKDVFNDPTIKNKRSAWAASSIVLNDDQIGQSLITRTISDQSALESLYSGYGDFPADAKVALHDMIYNLGLTNLKNEFPNFNAAINRRDWNTAAAESHRTGIQDARNDATKNQLLSAAKG
ncbi:hypothetical protein ASE93_12425 [Serratia sp. Leaf50]|nr:hypothetical protein ASE93_12425 [Serratia sp. Leaf50]